MSTVPERLRPDLVLRRLAGRAVRYGRRMVGALRRRLRSRTPQEGNPFANEIAAVAAGMKAYHRARTGVGSQALLRRNIHRLEKGLLMRPRRPRFAVKYIGETVDAFARATSASSWDRDELSWAGDVLRQYFSVANGDKLITEARASFERLNGNLPEPRDLVPYLRPEPRTDRVSYAALLALARHRRSVRWFLPDPVPHELLQQAMLVARESPSACNRQPFVFRVFDDPEVVQRVASIPMGTVGYVHNIPCIIVVVGQLRNYFDERDRHLIYIDGALAGMSFALALETLGLSSCMINWPDMPEKERQMAALLRLAPDERPVFLMAVGYPDPSGLVARSVKKPVDELLVFNVR